MSIGRVALVGAGPGDPGLLTVRAVELIREADVVAYDELVSESILALVPASAELLAVGRRAGDGPRAHAIHPDVLERARRGLRVVRLKAGDPLVFGRGGEEALDLARAGIPFEIVPGISAALGAASSAAIPLTHRDRSAQVVLSTGHRADGGAPPPDAPGGRTLVLYMAANELGANLDALVAAGWAGATPAALVVAATTADERVVDGTLATLAARVTSALGAAPKLPAVVLVGEAVGLREAIDWRARLPLYAKRVVVARGVDSNAALVCALRTLGGDVVELPLPGVDPGAPLVAPARWPLRVDLVVLPSPEGARALYDRAPPHVREAPAVAGETIEALLDAAVRATTAPDEGERG